MSNQNTNPWEEIPLSDYENHMKLDSVQQLQTMNRMMKRQFTLCGNGSAMVLGIAGGNGLEHVIQSNLSRIYGVDINSDYLEHCKQRYPQLDGKLECICQTLPNQLPRCLMLICSLPIYLLSILVMSVFAVLCQRYNLSMCHVSSKSMWMMVSFQILHIYMFSMVWNVSIIKCRKMD